MLWERNGEGRKAGAAEYRTWIEEETLLQGAKEDWEEKWKSVLALGSEAFLLKMRQIAKGNGREQPDVKRWKNLLGFERIQQAVESEKGEEWERFKDRRGDWGRDAALCLARRHTGMTLPEIAKAARVNDHRAAGKAIERFEKRLKTDPKMAKIIRRIEREMSHVGTFLCGTPASGAPTASPWRVRLLNVTSKVGGE